MKNDHKLHLLKHKIFKIILTLIAASLFVSCSKNYYYNGNCPPTQQTQFFNRDSAQCNLMASGAAPHQQVTLTSVPTSTTYSNFQAYGNNNQYYGSYSSQTSYDNTAYQMADMANMMGSITSDLRRTNVYWQCMTGKGWYKVKGKKLTPEERAFFGLPPEHNEQVEQHEITPEEHFKKVAKAHPDFMLIAQSPIFKIWRNDQSAEVNRKVLEGSADEVIEVLSRFKNSSFVADVNSRCKDWKTIPQDGSFNDWIKQNGLKAEYNSATKANDVGKVIGFYNEFERKN